MVAFYRHDKTLIKVYDADQDDVYVDFGEGQFWFSKSGRSLRDATLHALRVTCARRQIAHDESRIVFI
jgi:hypothetical protein